MTFGIEDVRDGYAVKADVVVVGSGAGGAVAAANFAAAGMETVLIEAGPEVKREEMTRNAPHFLAKYYWEGGLRLMEGVAPIPCMQGRCLGGSTVVNSAIMLELPQWVREEWIEDDGLTNLRDDRLDRCFERVFENTKTAATPMDAQGPRNLKVRDALDAIGVKNGPLPRAVQNCKGCADCALGCENGAKQSMDRTYIAQAMRDGAQVFTCSEVDRVIMDGSRAVGVEGRVVQVDGWKETGKFRVEADHVFLAAGATGTPMILQNSRVNPRRLVGSTFDAHLAGGVFGVMEERIDPWVGATQGWGAISSDIQGMKFESLWADPSIMLVKWGGFGRDLQTRLPDVANMLCAAVVYRGKCSGSVKVRRDGSPKIRFKFPKSEAQTVFRGMKMLADGLFRVGAKYVHAGVLPTVPEYMTDESQTEGLLSTKLGGHQLPMTGNHVFGSCRMTGDPRTGPVDLDGKVRGTDNLYVSDASLFPSPSAVNPQATVMALSDMVSRRVAELEC
jgi:choline dehydrogenase-like flavoprotein